MRRVDPPSVPQRAVVAVVVLLVPVGALLIADGGSTPLDYLLAFLGWVVVVGGIAAIVACLFADRSMWVESLLAAVGTGGLVALAIGAVTYGYVGEEQNGLFFRAVGGAVLGLVGWFPVALMTWRSRRATTAR